MKKTFLTSLMALAFCMLLITANAQDRLATIEKSLNDLVKTSPGLNEKVELSVNDVSIQEFIRGLAVAHNLNITVDPGLRNNIVNNFSNVTVKEVLLFLSKQYNLEIEFVGSIMSFYKYVAPLPEEKAYIPKKFNVEYNVQTDFLSFDLKKDSLDLVARRITQESLKNVVLAPDLEGKLVSVFIQNRPFDDAMDKLAFANDLVVTKTNDNFYLIEKKEAEKTKTTAGKSSQKRPGRKESDQLDIKIADEKYITVSAFDVAIADVIAGVSNELFKQYFLFSEPKGNTTLYIENATYEDFLSYLLNGSDFTYKKQDEVYLIGERKLEGLRATELVQLQYRTVETINDVIPPELKQDVNIKEFTELNSLILSGSNPKINEIKQFIKDIDKIVPVIMIEVLIVDVKKSRTISTGISAGIGTAPATPGGTILPDANYTFSTASINQLINSFNGFGFLNLGKVTPNFYLSIKALEDEGILNMQSTPILATLNSHEATLAIGNTEYYLEETNNVIGSQNPQNIITRAYKSINADLSLTIKPIVSGDEQITLEINVKQSDFTARISPDAPPGSVTRNFKSLIRVKNEEMILLGGLEEKSTNKTGRGVPLLSKIPILKWFFGTRSYEKKKGKLNIFIKPTVIY